MKARALWTVAPGVAEIRDHTLPPPAEGQALVVTRATGISRGTERLVFTGRVPESQWPAMRAPLQQGEFPYPVSYGYAAVGEVRSSMVLSPIKETTALPLDLVPVQGDGSGG